MNDLADELVIEESSQRSQTSLSVSMDGSNAGDLSYANGGGDFDSIIDDIFDKHSCA